MRTIWPRFPPTLRQICTQCQWQSTLAEDGKRKVCPTSGWASRSRRGLVPRISLWKRSIGPNHTVHHKEPNLRPSNAGLAVKWKLLDQILWSWCHMKDEGWVFKMYYMVWYNYPVQGVQEQIYFFFLATLYKTANISKTRTNQICSLLYLNSVAKNL